MDFLEVIAEAKVLSERKLRRIPRHLAHAYRQLQGMVSALLAKLHDDKRDQERGLAGIKRKKKKTQPAAVAEPSAQSQPQAEMEAAPLPEPQPSKPTVSCARSVPELRPRSSRAPC
jgi:hypothetical protein